MNIDALPVQSGIKKIIIEADGIKELYPPQEAAIKQGLLEGKNLVISIPTAAGKTLLAEIAALQHVTEKGSKVVYLCPLRALASEKYQNFKRFQDLGVKVAITSGDYDSKDHYLPRYDIIVSTNEKFDALLRHQVSWIEEEVSLVIVDECHLLNDQHRGPTLEILLARLLLRNTQLQIVALSATVGNSEELAEWLKAELVQSDWRPVPLKEGIYYDNYITYSDYTTRDIPYKKKEPLINLSLDSFHSQEQLLIFNPSRRSAVTTANKIGDQLESLLELVDKKKLTEKAKALTTNISDPLSQQLVACMHKGVAFHHAGLNSNQRTIIEESFKEGIIKILCATPTLAAGINVPAKRVIISSVYRYSVERGSYPIMTLEYKQMRGRAGRPQYDTEGEAILIAKQPHAVQWLMDRYILKGPEAVYSKLAAMPALRRSILGLIASKVIRDVEELLNFFEKTFYGFQYEAVLLEGKIREVIDMLIVWEMIDPLNARETLRATHYGVRVSQLYLDPETAANVVEGLKTVVERGLSKIHPLALFDLLVGTPDMVTLMFGKANQAVAEKRFVKFASRLIKPAPTKDDIEYDFRLRDFYTALFLWDWVNELPIEKLILRYKIGAGDVHRITDTATWLTGAISEIASIFAKNNPRFLFLTKKAESLSERVKYGIKSDAVSLTTIKGIGRKRARVLIDHGIRNTTQLAGMSQSKLKDIPGFGKELAKAILEETKEIKGSEADTQDEVNGTPDFFH
ncbi:MAG: DEAD/DEAH box helicase [Candidatus Hodarchaeales archaeon]|jgi:helicase